MHIGYVPMEKSRFYILLLFITKNSELAIRGWWLHFGQWILNWRNRVDRQNFHRVIEEKLNFVRNFLKWG